MCLKEEAAHLLMITYNLPCRQSEAGKELQTVPSPCPGQAAQQANQLLPAATSASTQQTPLEGFFLPPFPKNRTSSQKYKNHCLSREKQHSFVCVLVPTAPPRCPSPTATCTQLSAPGALQPGLSWCLELWGTPPCSQPRSAGWCVTGVSKIKPYSDISGA